MNKKILTVTALGLIISGSTMHVFSQSNTSIETKSLTVLQQQAIAKESLESSYFIFKNIWGGQALKLEFDVNTMKINAVSKSGNFSNSNDNFTFKLIDGSTNEILIDETSDSRYVAEFISKVNDRSFKYGDVIELNIKSSSGLGNPTLFNGDNIVPTSCVGKTQYFEITKSGIIKYDPELNIDNPYFMFKNIWGGDAIKVLFDQNTMKINGISKSSNLSDSTNNFTFKLIDNETKKVIISESADSKKTTDFISKINDKSYKRTDIIEINVKPSSGVKSPSLYSEEETIVTSCMDIPTYFEITEKGIIDYTPNINVSPIKILGEDVLKETTITGTTEPNSKISAIVEGEKFTATSDENGRFSIDIESKSGFTAHTAIEMRLGDLRVIVYPELLNKTNMKQETNTGYSYILNADIETLTTPLESDILYGRNLLSENAKKAWDIAYEALLKYENIDDKYPRDSENNVEFYVDYESQGVTINADEAQYIQKYLVLNEPRMIILKNWAAKPVYKDGVIIGQKFYIGNGVQDGDDYRQQLLKTEEAVSYLLSKITPDMSVYQIIKTLQVEYEKMVSYKNVSMCGDIRGAFINKQAVCGGFSKGFEYLLQRVGIENVYVTGFAGGYHAWNNINIYGTWYLADSTWGGINWYLRGSKGTENHKPYETYHVTPIISEDSVPWELGDIGQTIANLTGVANYENNNDGTITITYEDKENINTKMHVNTSLVDYEPIEMTKDENGIWSATISCGDTDEDTINFYFTIDEKFSTAGNVKANNLTIKTFQNGMKNIVVPVSNKSKAELANLINKCDFKERDYTKTSFEKYEEALENAIKVLNDEKALDVDVSLTYKSLQNAIENLVKANKIEFKGYNNAVFMTLEFDMESKKFIAASNGEMIHPYQYSKVYTKVQHFDQKGNLKNEYSVKANDTADKMAEALNNGTFVNGDYLKFAHIEKNNRLVIGGYVENAPYDLSTGSKDLDLENSLFYIIGESLTYSNEQLDLSVDKGMLIDKINELKEISGEAYTKTSFENLQNEIEKAEVLANSTNVLEEEILATLESLENARDNLRELNEIVFKGYNNNEFLKLSFDSEEKIFTAVSNGEVANRYVGGRYIQITHFDKKGNAKGTYSINGDQTADSLADSLNNLNYVDGDYLKLSHAEQNKRLVIRGYIENIPFDMSTGSKDLDLSNSLFYLGHENLVYSNEQLDLSANKAELIEKIEAAKSVLEDKYTKSSYENLQQAIYIAEELAKSTNVLEEEIFDELKNLEDALNNLKKVNRIEFKGYNNIVFMTLEFDTENNKFKAVSNGQMVHPYQYSRVYVKVEHFDQKGNLKGEYSAIANKTADEMAQALNNLSYEKGDYIKLSHLEKHNRLVVDGYIEDVPFDLSKGVKDLDLNNSYFYLGYENLVYSNKQLDLSADKTELILKVNEMKKINSDKYTKISFENLQKKIEEGQTLVNSTNVLEVEISTMIEQLEHAKNSLRELNEIVFRGYNNNEFLKLSFDSENKVFKSVSNGEVANRFVGGKYIQITCFDKDGNVKGTYSINGGQTADSLADSLNNLEYEEGDYLKLYHKEQNNRLIIKGYINNLDISLSNGVGSLDLNNAKFNLDGENLTYLAE